MMRKILVSVFLITTIGLFTNIQFAAAAEVGGHGIEYYDCGYPACYRAPAYYAEDNAENFVDELVDYLDYDNNYERYGCAADEDDFVDNDDNYVDDADIAYFCGHGSAGQIFFATVDDYCNCWVNNMQLGDIDLEWLILDSCYVLNYTFIVEDENWPFNAFDGLHHIFGFNTGAIMTSGRGESFARYADGNDSSDKLELAWVKATQDYGVEGDRGAIIRDATTDCYDDYLPGVGDHASDGSGNTLYYYEFAAY